MMRGLAGVLACALLAACDGDDDDVLDAGVPHADAAAADAATGADAGTGWSCLENGVMCKCSRVPIAGLHQFCTKAFSCCVSSADTCTCNSSTSCAAQAKSMGGEIVPHCIPGTRPMVTCAGDGEICMRDALEMLQLDGCCEGLVCKPYGDVRICRPGTPTERALAKQCGAAAGDPEGMRNAIALGTVLTSSRGDLPFDIVLDAHVQLGPNGCFSQIDLTLTQTNRPHCTLVLHAGPDADANGALVFAPDATLDTRNCDDLPADARTRYATSALAGTLVFDGLSCESGLRAEQWCEAGFLDLKLQGIFLETAGDEDGGAGRELSFDDAAVKLRGRMCGSMTATSCPMSQ
jgi:hypothetical protein